jgi:hypothetical protein
LPDAHADDSGVDGGVDGGSTTEMLTVGNAAVGQMHVDLPDQSSVLVVSGPQGGFHIWLSVGIRPVEGSIEDYGLSYLVTSDGTQVGIGSVGLYGEVTDASYEQSGVVMFFDGSVVAAGWTSKPVHIMVELRRNNSSLATVERDWLASCCDSGGGGTPGDAGVNGPSSGCSRYCAAVESNCANGVYPLETECLVACEDVPTLGLTGMMSGNTIQCWQAHAEGDACADIQSNIEAACVNGCEHYCDVMGLQCPHVSFSDGGCLQDCLSPSGDAGTPVECLTGYARAASCSDAELAGFTCRL